MMKFLLALAISLSLVTSQAYAATHALTLGQNIQTAVTAGSAGDTYTFADGIYRGQTWTPKQGDIYIGAPDGGTILSGSAVIATPQWTNVSGSWYRATQGTTDAGTSNFPTPFSLWQGTATISGTTLTIVSTTSGTMATGGGGVAIYGNGVAAFTSLVSGSGTTWTITPSQTISSTTTMVTQNQAYENGANGVAPVDPQTWTNEELFVDGVRYTRIQAAGTPVAPGAGQWFWDYSNNTVNININPTGHTIEYSQATGGIVNNQGALSYTMSNMTVQEYGGFQISAINTGFNGGVPGVPVTLILNNVTANFNKGFGAGLGGSGSLQITGGHYNDNGECGIVGSPTKGYIVGAEIARNNANSNYSTRYQAAGIKLTGAKDSIFYQNNVHDNGGPGIWNDIYSVRNIIDHNIITHNVGPGIMDEISTYARIYYNTISNEGLESANIDAGIYISNSSNAEVAYNTITVGTGHPNGGGIDMYNGVRGSSGTVNPTTITGYVIGSTLTVTATTASIDVNASGQPMQIYAPGMMVGTYVAAQLTGSAGSTGTYQLSFPQPNIYSVGSPGAFNGIEEANALLAEVRNSSIHNNTIVYLDAAGATDGFSVGQTIVGGSNNYKDWNTYYTPNGSGTFWEWGTDAGVNTNYTWTNYQAAGFEPHSTNIVGLPPAQSPLVTAGVPIKP